ncbi:GNAT family N-acetyltransferase [Agrobacterium rubi]|uniref:GNAT family N-acetyltransferase n=1 Tax=Agrobacterium rubi TaxID=28099 RepID=A0AAE7R2R4_9HYPH|nr:GNAT family N-acetyltransferase [Agrobacterium rubi]NTE87706.1 GNAT family N-acetyltransferase [Agrobacterium rubi]NTF03560.1 GNAT family N-acetyltransferase [Agrobacterium rubi]NTF37720.1 GNAT family N-acetyltransferase [Agrobacterium rubi]OCJ45601.1 acetyltransferase [Agrobacterium rubi]QTG00119.1 GNAT family N-acetyltransferase [Agrobacterium rubi]
MRTAQAENPLARPSHIQTLETRRLVLRPQRLSDAGSIAQSLSDFQITRMLARVPAPYYRQDALEWLILRTAGPGWDFAITCGDDTLIGVVSIEELHGEWRLGYWLDRAHWGKGYMSEAVAGVVEHFFQQMPEEVLYSGMFADNPASLRVQEKLGFQIIGCHEIYAVARAGMVTHLDTALTAETFRKPRP